MTFSDNFITIMDELGKRLGIAIDWTNQNIVPYLQDLGARLIKFEVMTSITYIAICFVITAIFAILASFFHKKAMALEGTKKYCYACEAYDDNCAVTWFAIFSWVALGILAIVTIGVTCVQIFDIIQAITFPEKTIFEYISSLLNNGQA